MTRLILDDIDPKMLVSANQRIHHHKRAEVCRYWRMLTGYAAVQTRKPRPGGALSVFTGKVRVVVTVRYPDRRRRDVGNLYPYVAKPCVDALVDALWLADDSDDHVIGPDLRRDPVNGPHRVVVDVEEAT